MQREEGGGGGGTRCREVAPYRIEQEQDVNIVVI